MDGRKLILKGNRTIHPRKFKALDNRHLMKEFNLSKPKTFNKISRTTNGVKTLYIVYELCRAEKGAP